MKETKDTIRKKTMINDYVRVRNRLNGDLFLKPKAAVKSYTDGMEYVQVLSLDGKRNLKIRSDYLETV